MALTAASCQKTRTCSAGSVLLTLEAPVGLVDSVRVSLSVDGMTKGQSPVYPLPARGPATLAIALGADYRPGRTVLVQAEGLAGGLVVAHGQATRTLPATCATLPLRLASDGSDLGAPVDGGADLALPPPADGGRDMGQSGVDLAPPPLVPSHDVGGFDPTAPDAPLGITALDTSNLTIALNGGSPKADSHFQLIDGKAVYFVHAITFDQPVAVTGTNPLVIVAAGQVDLRAVIDAAAKNTWTPGHTGVITPGPGGFAAQKGPGAGANGGGGSDRWGGGGGSFGSSGGYGGALSGAKGTTGAPGAVNGGALGQFYGGSGGAAGYQSSQCGRGLGGAGGGAVQISSATAIVVRAGGGIWVGGAGGIGGCGDGDGGGGGGAGGLVLLEAPTLQIAGLLAANGGGGGSGIDELGTWMPGQTGSLGGQPALGGQSDKVAAGGNGAAGSTAATDGSQRSGGGYGGGGGGAGRIWLRTRKTPADTTGGTISPPPMLDSTF